MGPGMTLAKLPSDVYVEILQFADSPRDLLNACLASRGFLDAYTQYRAALVRGVVRRYVEKHGFTCCNALAYVRKLRENQLKAAKTRTFDRGAPQELETIDDQISIFEAVQALMLSGQLTTPVLEWAASLCRFYRTAGGSLMLGKRLTILEYLYSKLLVIPKQIDLEPDEKIHRILALPESKDDLSRAQILLCRELCQDYATTSQLEMQLEVQRQVVQRVKFMSPECKEWGSDIVRLLRNAHRHDEAIVFAMRMYVLCRSRNPVYLMTGLMWARDMIQDYTTIGDFDSAIEHQKMVLADLDPGLKEHAAWARQTIVMLKRAGRCQEAVQIKHDIWRRMTVHDKCYFGWARELAGDYRNLNLVDEAKGVIQAMYLETQRQATRHSRDVNVRFHLHQAIRSKAIAFGSDDAAECH